MTAVHEYIFMLRHDDNIKTHQNPTRITLSESPVLEFIAWSRITRRKQRKRLAAHTDVLTKVVNPVKHEERVVFRSKPL